MVTKHLHIRLNALHAYNNNNASEENVDAPKRTQESSKQQQLTPSCLYSCISYGYRHHSVRKSVMHLA
jgi:hypothetical protein